MATETQYGNSHANQARTGGDVTWTFVASANGSNTGTFSRTQDLAGGNDKTDYLKGVVDDFAVTGTITSTSISGAVYAKRDADPTAATIYTYLSDDDGATWCAGHSNTVGTTAVWETYTCSHITWTSTSVDKMQVRSTFDVTVSFAGKVYIASHRQILNYTAVTVPGTSADPTLNADAVGQIEVTKPSNPSDGGATITHWYAHWGVSSSVPVETGNSGDIAIGTTTYDATSLGNGNLFYFEVRFKNSEGYGPYSPGTVNETTWDVASAPGWAATKFPAETTASIQLDWTTPGDDGGTPITEYWYQWKIDGGSYATVDTNSTNTIATKSSLASGTKYWFKVLARNAVGSSPYNAENAWHTLCVTLPFITVTPDAVGQLTVDWGSVQGVNTWDVEQSNDGSTGWVAVAGSPFASGTLETSISGLGNGTLRYYRARANNADGNPSAWSPNGSNTTWDLPTVPLTFSVDNQ